ERRRREGPRQGRRRRKGGAERDRATGAAGPARAGRDADARGRRRAEGGRRTGRRRGGGRVNGEPRWSDARAAAGPIEGRPTERRVLVQLVGLPFASARTMAGLLGLADADRVYRCLANLRAG